MIGYLYHTSLGNLRGCILWFLNITSTLGFFVMEDIMLRTVAVGHSLKCPCLRALATTLPVVNYHGMILEYNTSFFVFVVDAA